MFEIGQRVYIKPPEEISVAYEYKIGEILDLYENDLGVEMAEISLDGMSIHTIYIGVEKLREFGGY